MLDVPSGTVKSRCARARARLAEQLCDLDPTRPHDEDRRTARPRERSSAAPSNAERRHHPRQPDPVRRGARVTDDHLSLDELAELDEGLLSPERTSAIRAHLHGCDECRARARGDRDHARRSLADLPTGRRCRRRSAPASTQALDDEAAERGPRQRAEAAGIRRRARPRIASDARSPAPGTVARRRFGRPTLPSSAVAAALVLAVGAIVVGAVNHGNVAPTRPAARAVRLPEPHQPAAAGCHRPGPAEQLRPDLDRAGLHPHHAAQRRPGTRRPDARQVLGVRARGQRERREGGTGRRPPASRRLQRNTSTAPTRRTTPSTSPSALTKQPVPKVLQPLANSRSKILACAALLDRHRQRRADRCRLRSMDQSAAVPEQPVGDLRVQGRQSLEGRRLRDGSGLRRHGRGVCQRVLAELSSRLTPAHPSALVRAGNAGP